MVVQRRDGAGVVIGWGGRLLALSPSRVDPTAVSPSKARILGYAIKAKEDV
jgi:hypothetical protein